LVNRFLEFNEYKVLEGHGTISHQQAMKEASEVNDEYNIMQKIESDFDKETKKLLDKSK
jgi:hypothetical protein